MSVAIAAPCIEIRDTGTIKGHGVFALSSFLQGDVVEVCPVVVFCLPWQSLPESLQLRVFDWTTLAKREPNTYALALGYGSMYNNANPANMRYEADRYGTLLRFIAVREIAAGEELTIFYSANGGGAEWINNVWFARLQIDPI